MAINVLVPGVRQKVVPRRGWVYRVAFGIAKPFLTMSVVGALKSANAQEFMLPCPAGEDNWRSRQTFCSTLAEAIEKHPGDVPAGFGGMLEPFWANLLDCAICERTTLSIQACRLLGALPGAMRRDFTHHYDRVLPVLIRQCASTKSVAQKSASAAICNVITFAGFNPRLLYHVCSAFEDKYSGPKLYAPTWLKLIIENYHPALHADRDYDQISRAIALGLEEADNNVRINNRATFWAYHKINATGADEIMAKLNNHARTALLNDPNNPDKNAKSKTKKPADATPALAEIRQQAKERMKQKTSERNRVVSTKTIASVDFPFGPLNMSDDKPAQTQAPITNIAPEVPKTKSRPIAIHKKGSSHDAKVVSSINTVSSMNTVSSVNPETSSNARPLLSAPVRRPRIVATPINQTQTQSQSQNQTSRRPASRMISEGKENTDYYSASNLAKRIDRTSPERIVTPIPKASGPQGPGKIIVFGASDNATKEKRLAEAKLDTEISEMLPHMPLMAAVMNVQDEEKNTQMYYTYPALNHDGEVQKAREGLEKALEYLNKDALDHMGFRKLRKLLEVYGGHLITDQALYDLLFSELLPRLGTFDELLTMPLHELKNQDHPRYIRQAVLTMVNILIRDYPYEWSYQYQGPALASCMIARCAYSANCDPHDGAPYVHRMAIVNQINACIQTIVDGCTNPVMTLDAVMDMLSASEDFLFRTAPCDSETQKTFASFNPYSKINRVRTENNYLDPRVPLPKHLLALQTEDPTPLPQKLPLLMETGLRIIKQLISRAALEQFPLGPARENGLADLARHLMSSYNVIIRRQVMEYCQVLFTIFESTERFWTLFPNESDRNLLHYYLERSREMFA